MQNKKKLIKVLTLIDFLYLILLLVYGGDSQEAPKKNSGFMPEFFLVFFPLSVGTF